MVLIERRFRSTKFPLIVHESDANTDNEHDVLAEVVVSSKVMTLSRALRRRGINDMRLPMIM